MQRRRELHHWLLFIFAAGVALVFAAHFAVRQARAADNGYNPAWSAWFQSLNRYNADSQTYTSCCGDGDAVFADDWQSTGDGVIATVTDNRGHAWVKVGTKIVVPKKFEIPDKGNPTGHVVLFLRPADLSPICIVIGGELI